MGRDRYTKDGPPQARHDPATPLAARIVAARADPGRVVLEGLHALKHALRFGAAVELVLTPEPKTILALARTLAPDLETRLDALLVPVDAKRFAMLASRPLPSPVLAIARRPAWDAEMILRGSGAPVVVLDRPRHPGNLGAAVRVAAAAEAGAC